MTWEILTKYKISKASPSVMERTAYKISWYANKCGHIPRLRGTAEMEMALGCTHTLRTIFVTFYWDEHVVVAAFIRAVT